MAESWDPNTRKTVSKIPLLTVKAGPREKEEWQKRLKEVGALSGAAGCWLPCHAVQLQQLRPVLSERRQARGGGVGRRVGGKMQLSRRPQREAAGVRCSPQRALLSPRLQELQALIKYIGEGFGPASERGAALLPWHRSRRPVRCTEVATSPCLCPPAPCPQRSTRAPT